MRCFSPYLLWTAENLKHSSHRRIEMDNLLQRMQVDMDLRNLGEKTKQIYLWQVRTFVRHYGRSPQDMGVEEIRAYLHHLIVDRNLSQDYIKQAYSALKLLYETTLDRGWDLNKIPHAKQKKKLPVVLSQQQVRVILEAAPNLKYHALFMTAYSAGLRLSEAAHLKLTDIDGDQMRIRVNNGKGGKDRYTLLAKRTLLVLRDYWRVYRPKDWLFTGKYPDRPLSTRPIQTAFQKTREKAGIRVQATVRTLRHCFATHLHDAGVDLYYISQLLGHASIKTTVVYLHLSGRRLSQIVSPLDQWETPPVAPREEGDR